MKCRVAICGLIASGKSIVGGILANKGYTVLDSDKLSRQVASDSDVIGAVGQLLGEEYIVGNQLDRVAIRNKVFGDANLLEQYTSIFSVRVALLIEACDSQLVFVELPSPDMLPVKWDYVCQVVALDNDRVLRGSVRDNVAIGNIESISSRQNQEYNSNYVIVNDKDIEGLGDKVDKMLIDIVKY